ncbi:ABC transporter permease subunit [Streptomyces sp. CAU 1734]|uniref:ABC transporter permease subunit n=1 Tax=Streptomyces sp. CAU 1734 TaxID=3140360 RepID=UPI0032612E67
MSTPTTTIAGPAGTGRRSLLRGMSWVVWRRNRTALLLMLAVTAVFCALSLYERIGLMDFLDAQQGVKEAGGLPESPKSFINNGTFAIGFLPIVIGVFLGAPLLAAEEESGTLRLTMTQSTGRLRVIASTLAVPLLAVLLCTTLIAAAFTALWSPARNVYMGGDWWVSGIVATTGPMPVALSLFSAAVGITAGAFLRRSVPAMALTFVILALGAIFMVQRVANWLADPHLLSYPINSEQPPLKTGQVQIDRWFGTADGELFGYGNCALPTEKATEECYSRLGIINDVVGYLEYGQLGTIQWTMAAILLSATAMLIAVTVWWTRRKSL